MDADLRSCPYCHQPVRTVAIKCKHCGGSLGNGKINQPDEIDQVRAALAGTFDISREIGHGGMAVVYKAEQSNPRRAVALKVLPRHLTHDKELLSRFHREASSVAKLQHPNIVRVFDEGVANDIHYMAMEYLDGSDLYSLVRKKGPLPARDVLIIATALTSALDYAHAHGLVHRDVKSSNIFMTTEGRPVLTDFGIAHAMTGSELTVSGTILGTPEFMSPEQAGGRSIDGRTDFYSLGVVLYHALCGHFPFQGTDPMHTIYRILHEPYRPLRLMVVVPEPIERLVDACLTKDVVRRPRSGSELMKLVRPVRKKRRKSRSVELTIFALIVSLILLLAVYMLRKGGGTGNTRTGRPRVSLVPRDDPGTYSGATTKTRLT